MIRYAKPTTLDEALALLGEDRWRILAGGTDFYPAQGAKPFRENILDINGLAELRGVAETVDHWRIGARATWTDMARHPLPEQNLTLRMRSLALRALAPRPAYDPSATKASISCRSPSRYH